MSTGDNIYDNIYMLRDGYLNYICNDITSKLSSSADNRVSMERKC